MANEKRLIDANALIEKFRQHRDLLVSAWNGTKEMPPKDKARVDELGMCIAETLNAPTVDAVEVVHGRWEWITEDIYGCNNCGATNHVKEVMGQPDFNFCPNCGAKMDGKEN